MNPTTLIRNCVKLYPINPVTFVSLPQGSSLSLDCVRSFSETDFRKDVQKIDVPTLIIHGDADHIVPVSASKKTAALVPHAKYVVYEGAPHGLFITHKERLNKDLMDFIANGS